jgi:hypothetical protein
MIEHQEAVDFTYVPESKGIGRGTTVILVIGLLMIFTMGGLSAFLSGWGHMWPSNTTLRDPLGSMPK